MKRFSMIIAGLVLVGAFAGCASVPKVVLAPGVSDLISVERLAPNTASLTKDQITYLENTLEMMDSDLVNSLNRRGFRASLQRSDKDAPREGHVLKVSIILHKLVPRAARIWAGRMAGADRLDLRYELIDDSGKTILAWENSKASTESGVKVAYTLNREAAAKVAQQLGSR